MKIQIHVVCAFAIVLAPFSPVGMGSARAGNGIARHAAPATLAMVHTTEINAVRAKDAAPADWHSKRERAVRGGLGARNMTPPRTISC